MSLPVVLCGVRARSCEMPGPLNLWVKFQTRNFETVLATAAISRRVRQPPECALAHNIRMRNISFKGDRPELKITDVSKSEKSATIDL